MRPILFNGEMVRAILDGRKVQTRRFAKIDTPACIFDVKKVTPKVNHIGDNRLSFFWKYQDIEMTNHFNFPFGKPGDSLWVRETWGYFDPSYDGIEWVPDRPFKEVKEMKFGKGYVDGNIIWAADGSFFWSSEDSAMEERSAWKPSIHMPRWASRINLQITKVRVERLQDITEDDARSEGVLPFTHVAEDQLIMCDHQNRTHGTHPHTLAFASLWDGLAGEETMWKQNPWVWVIEFKRIKI